jgi:hypothetical protein
MVRVPATVVPLHSPWERIEQAFGARPTGVDRADARNIRIPIEGAEDGIMPRALDPESARTHGSINEP